MAKVIGVRKCTKGASGALVIAAGPQAVIILSVGFKPIEVDPVTVVVFEACGD